MGLGTRIPGRCVGVRSIQGLGQGMVPLAGVWMPGMCGMSSLSMGTWGVMSYGRRPTKTSAGLPVHPSPRPHLQARMTSQPHCRKLRSCPGHTGRDRCGLSPGHHPRLGAGWCSSTTCAAGTACSVETDHRAHAPFSPTGGSGHQCPGDTRETTAAEWARGWTASKGHGHVSRLPCLFL